MLVIDFDGTLAVGSRDPAVARIEPLAQRALRRLAALAAMWPDRLSLVVLTGRVVADVPRASASAASNTSVTTASSTDGCHARARRAAGHHDRSGLRCAPRYGRHARDRRRRRAWVAAVAVRRTQGPIRGLPRSSSATTSRRRAPRSSMRSTRGTTPGLVHGLAHYRGRSVVDLPPARTPAASVRRSSG
jgi:hypothetical protein